MLITNLLTNMVLVTSLLSIQTNTPAFSNCVLHKAVADAQFMAAKLHWDQGVVTTNTITRIRCFPTAHGPTAEIVFNRQYYFEIGWERQYLAFPKGHIASENPPTVIWGDIARDCSIRFMDLSYCWLGYSDRQFASNVVSYEWLALQWANASNLLTLEKAEQIAESGIRSIGISMDNMKFKVPDVKEQRTELWDGAPHSMPYYTFVWKTDKGFCQVDVSGLSSNIAFFRFEGQCPELEFSTNLFHLLGISSNTVFVLPTHHDIYRHPLPPYRLFPYPIPMEKNQPVGVSIP